MSAMRKVKFAVLESSLLARKGAARPAMSPQMVHDDGMVDEASYAPLDRAVGDQGATEAVLASLITRPFVRPVLAESVPVVEPAAPKAAESDQEIIKTWTRKVAKDRRLATNLHPRGLNREQAAQYVGLSISTFNRLVAEGILPRALRFGRRRVWDRRMLDAVLDQLSGVARPSIDDA